MIKEENKDQMTLFAMRITKIAQIKIDSLIITEVNIFSCEKYSLLNSSAM